MPACDGQTDRQTDGRTDVKPIAITCFSIADARKNDVGSGSNSYVPKTAKTVNRNSQMITIIEISQKHDVGI